MYLLKDKIKRHHKTIIFFIIPIYLILCVIFLKYFQHVRTDFYVTMRSSQDAKGQIFYDSGKGYNEIESVWFNVVESDDYITYKINMPRSSIRSVRLDPMKQEGFFVIKSMSFHNCYTNISLQNELLQAKVLPIYQVEVSYKDGLLKGFSTGIDPQIEINDIEIETMLPIHLQVLIIILLLLLSMLLVIIVFFIRSISYSLIFYRFTFVKFWLWAIIAIIVIVIVARLAMALFNQGSYYDEYLHIGAALGAILNYQRGAFVTWGVALILQLFGYSLPAVKLIPAFLGVINTLILWRIARYIFKKQGYIFLALLLYAVSPWVVFNHFYIRMYVFLEFAVLLTLWFGVRLFSKDSIDRLTFFIGIIAITINMIYIIFAGDSSRFVPIVPLITILSLRFINRSRLFENKLRCFKLKLARPKTRIFIVLMLFGIALTSILSQQNFLEIYFLGLLRYSDSAYKYDQYFFLLNIVFTMLFMVGLFYSLRTPISAQSLFILATFSLFMIHALAGYQYQMIRAILYFQGPFIFAAVYGFEQLRLKQPLNALIIIALLLTILNNYPKPVLQWIKEPDIPREITYRGYAPAIKMIKTKGVPLYGITALSPTLSSFYEVQIIHHDINAAFWQPKEIIEAVIIDFLKDTTNAFLIVDVEGYSRLREHELDQLLEENLEMHRYPSIWVYSP